MVVFLLFLQNSPIISRYATDFKFRRSLNGSQFLEQNERHVTLQNQVTEFEMNLKNEQTVLKELNFQIEEKEMNEFSILLLSSHLFIK